MRDQGTIWFCAVLGALWDAMVSKVVSTYACQPRGQLTAGLFRSASDPFFLVLQGELDSMGQE